MTFFHCTSRRLWFVLAFYWVSGCASSGHPPPSAESGKELRYTLSADWAVAEKRTLELIRYAEESEKWRHWARTAYQTFDDFQKSHQGKIASKDLIEIKRMGSLYADKLWHPLRKLKRHPIFFMRLARDVQIQTHRESYIEADVVRYVDSMGDEVAFREDTVNGTVYEKKLVNIYHINPFDTKGQIFLREFEISFGAALVLMDNFVWGWESYMNNKVIRRNLIYDVQGSQDDVRSMVKVVWQNYRGYQNPMDWIAAFDLYEKVRRTTQKPKDPGSPLADPLKPLIQSTSTFKLLSNESQRNKFIYGLSVKMKAFLRQRGDALNHIGNRATHTVSKAFGNGAGLFQFRKGKLKHLSESEIQGIEDKLKPLDILFEKTPFRLTDKFIPGHYGHVAIWVGTEEELRELGIWEKLPELYKTAVERYAYPGPSFQRSIRSGHSIVEALRSGVEMHSMTHFLDIDDLAVIRPKHCPRKTENGRCLTPEKKRQYLLEAFKQVGKKYDFNFDVNTESEIVCSELAYRTFVDLDFSTTRAFGKHSMSPDQVALMADEPTDPFYPVLLYFDGKYVPVEGESLRDILSLLLKKEYSSVEAAISSQADDH